MIATCRLCGQLMNGQLVAGPGSEIPLIGEDGRAEIEYQASIMQLVNHVLQAHPDYARVFQSTAQTYLFHLIAKLAVSSDPSFEQQREDARRLVYWTLAGKLEFSGPNQPPVTV